MDKIDDCKNEFGLSSGNSLSIWEKFTPLILDILPVLDSGCLTAVKGE